MSKRALLERAAEASLSGSRLLERAAGELPERADRSRSRSDERFSPVRLHSVSGTEQRRRGAPRSVVSVTTLNSPIRLSEVVAGTPAAGRSRGEALAMAQIELQEARRARRESPALPAADRAAEPLPQTADGARTAREAVAPPAADAPVGGQEAQGPISVTPDTVLDCRHLPTDTRLRAVGRRLCAVLRHDSQHRNVRLLRDAQGYSVLNHVAAEIEVHPRRVEEAAADTTRFQLKYWGTRTYIRAISKHTVEVEGAEAARPVPRTGVDIRDVLPSGGGRGASGGGSSEPRICWSWSWGTRTCKYGERCRFLHQGATTPAGQVCPEEQPAEEQDDDSWGGWDVPATGAGAGASSAGSGLRRPEEEVAEGTADAGLTYNLGDPFGGLAPAVPGDLSGDERAGH